MQNENNSNFFLPLSPEVVHEFQDLQNLLNSSNWNADSSDHWIYHWKTSTSYVPKKAYNLLLGSQQASPLFEWMWKGENLGKHKFFFWLLHKDQLSTRNMLRRKNMQLTNYSCAICNLDVEEPCSISSLTAP